MTTPFVLFVSIILIGVGWPVVGVLDRGKSLNNGERLTLSLLIGCYFNYLGVFAISLFRLDALSMWGWVAVMGACALPGLRQIPWSQFKHNLTNEVTRSRADFWLGLLWLTVLAIGLSSLIQGMAPPNDYDSLMYHLTQPQYDVEMGRLSIPWDRAIGTELFPALAGNLSRLALAIVGPGAAQMLHGVLGVIGGVGAALLVLRMGGHRKTALAAALFFLATRVVIWEMATVETDVSLAAYTIGAVLAYLAFRHRPSFGLALLTGLLIGFGILTKYHGFLVAAAFGPLILFDLTRGRIPLNFAAALPLTSLVSLLPHMVRNYALTANPIYPLFNTFFNPDKHNFFVAAAERIEGAGGYGTGRDLIDLLATPWNMFVYPMQVFDGMIFGAPYLFAFAPLLLLEPKQLKKWAPALSVAVFYFLGWFYLIDFQVRFLTPIVPILAAAAAVGFVMLWQRAEPYILLRFGFAGLAVLIGINQLLFVGVYSVIRLPAAIGLMSSSDYHLKTPTMNGAMYGTCTYIRDNLKSGERYFSSIQPHSYYCPQAAAINNIFPERARWWLKEETPKPAELSLENFIERAERHSLQFFIAPARSYNRRNHTAKMIITEADNSTFRYGRFLVPAFSNLTPLKSGPYTNVYDGPAVIAQLKSQLADRNK